jgi:anti-sigma factor RsiW
MKHPEQNDLLLKGLKGELNDQEKAALDNLLAADPLLKSEREDQLALNELLAKIPDAPLSSNFTALVMQAVRQSEKRPGPATPFRWFSHGFARVAAGLAVVTVIGFGLNHHYQTVQRSELAAGLRDFTTIASTLDSQKTPAVEMFQDFDAIQKLSRVPANPELDMELLVALQK